MREELTRLEGAFLALIAQSQSMTQLEATHHRIFGRKGQLTLALRSLREAPEADRPVLGKLSNRVKESLQHAMQQRRDELRKSALETRLEFEQMDVTLPGVRHSTGRLHPLRELEAESGLWFRLQGFVPAQVGPLPENLTGLRGRKFGSRRTSGPGWGGWGHCEGLKDPPTDPAHGHLLEAVAMGEDWTAGQLKGWLETWGRQFLGYVSLRSVPGCLDWARPSLQLLGPFRGGWLAVASAGLCERGACIGIALERAAAVRYNLEPTILQSTDWRFVSQF